MKTMIESAGEKAGYEWAMKQPNVQEIAARVAELLPVLCQINDAYTPGEHLYFAIVDDRDRDAASEFWASLGFDFGDNPDADFVAGFAEGILSFTS